MAFTDHKITEFQKKLADLPDEPNLSAAELKGYFDSSPEELRGALNGVCEDAARLDTRVSGIVTETFGDAIPKSMLTAELQAEIDAKAEETALTAKTEALQTQIDTLTAEKCECYFGTYTGDGKESRFIPLGFTPKAVLLFDQDGTSCLRYTYYTYTGGLALPDEPVTQTIGSTTYDVLRIVENGFMVGRYYEGHDSVASNYGKHYFIAFR